MNKEASVEKFHSRFQKLWNVIKGSQSNEGFIRNIIDRLIIFFEEDLITKDIISYWKNLPVNEPGLLYRAYKELSDAVDEIRKHSEDDHSALEYLEKILEEVRKEGSCAFLKEVPIPYDFSYYKLRVLYVNKVSKTSDLTFAPFTFSLIKSLNPSYITARNDTEPRCLWNQLLALKEFWSYTNHPIDVYWPRVNAEGLDLWLEADNVRRQAFLRMVGGRLRDVDLPNHDKDYFDREYFHKLIERLVDELLLLVLKDVPTIEEEYVDKTGEGTPWRTLRNKRNKSKLRPLAIKCWKQQIIEKKQNPKNVTVLSIVKLLETYVSENEIDLKNPTNNLYIEIARETNPRIYKRGAYVGLKPEFIELTP